jgi:hypothetical protein
MTSAATLCSKCQLLHYDPSVIVDLSLQASKRFLPLTYKVEDDYPALPGLRQSAKEGCLACGFLAKVVRNHCLSDPALLKGWRDEEERLKTCPRDVTTPQKVRLVLSRFYYLGVEFLQAPSTVGPWYISGELFLVDIVSAVRIDVDYNARGESSRQEIFTHITLLSLC